jgi:epsin
MKKTIRSVYVVHSTLEDSVLISYRKNVTKGYSDAQVKVRKATSNEAWGPEGADMADIAQMTFDSHDFLDVMDMLDRRMNDRGKMWRHVYKVVVVMTLLTSSSGVASVRLLCPCRI